MAIQFHCPYCTASIRVPDSAAGKRGTCPKCASKLIVPQVAPPTAPLEPGDAPKASVGPPEEVPAFPADLPIASGPPSMAQVVRRRKRKKTNLLVPIVFFSLMLAVIGYWVWKPADPLSGQLSAERLTDFAVPTVLIEKSSLPLAAEEIDPAWEELKLHPPAGVLIRDRFEMLFLPEASGLKIEIRKTPQTEVFRVRTDRAIRQSIEQHAETIRQQRQAEFSDAIERFLKDWQSAMESDVPFLTDSFFKPLGFNRLAEAGGYAIVAKIGNRTYRCIHEDAKGDLYFLLPKDTKEFVLIGRKLPDGKTIFPGRFTVEVHEPASPGEQESKAPEPAKPKPEPESKSEPESKPEPEPPPSKTVS